MFRKSLAGVAAITLVLAGCGERGPVMVEVVEGVVSLDGKPLEKVRVEFWPLNNGPQSAALTDEQGRYSLATVDGTQRGAVLGKHKVVLRDVSIVNVEFHGRDNENVDTTGGKKPRISTKYVNPTTTPLEVEVSEDKSDLTLEVVRYGR